MIEWSEYKIIDVGKTITGTTPSSKNPEHFGNLIPFVTPTDFKNFNKYIESTDRYLSKNGVDNLKNRLLPANSVIVTCIGSDMGKVAINKIPCVTNQQINSIILNNKIADSDFVYYKLISIYAFFRNLATGGSTMPIINKTDFENITIELPPLAEQRAIAKILSCLDDKIELNRKMNQTLEQITQAIFKHWFIDFEFPNEAGKPYKSSGGEMVDSELGAIPKGWNVIKLSNFANIINGFAFKSDDYTNEGIPIIRTKNFNNNGFIELNDIVFISTDKINKYSKYELKKFDFLLVMVGASLGKSVMVTSHALPSLQNQNMWNFRCKIKNGQLYLLNIVRKITNENIKSATGSAREFFRKDYFYDLKMILPDELVLKAYNQIVEPFYEKIDGNIFQYLELSKIHSLILPKLISGKIRVKTDL